jgi:hypothetical protein
VVRAAQHYVKLYKDDNEKRLPGVQRANKGGMRKKLETEHTAFLIDFYQKNASAVLWEARAALLSAFPDIGSISLAALHYHLTKHASLTLKKLEKLVKARIADVAVEQRREKALQWKSDEEMDWKKNCVFIDEAGFNMHIRRNFNRSKRGKPAKVELPKNRCITITIVGAICERGIINLTLRKPKAVQRKVAFNKKRKRSDGTPDGVAATAKIGTRSEHFLEFIEGVMDTLDKHDMKDRYIVMDNAAIHKVSEIQEAILKRGYKPIFLHPYSPLLSLIELFWSKLKTGVKRDCLAAEDNLSQRTIESSKKVTSSNYDNWIKHCTSFFDDCIARKPMM